MEIQEHNICRLCGDKLATFFSLGTPYPSGFYRGAHNYPRVPLDLARCALCGLVQLRHSIALDDMYLQYWYRSGLNSSMVADLKDICDYSLSFFGELGEKDIVLDIGCNDGTLLNWYTQHHLTRVGVDPSVNLADEARRHSDHFINDYFSAEKYLEVVGKKARIVTSIAMFYDLNDPVAFAKDVRKVLEDDGIWIIQMTDLGSMLRLNAFDNICFEHVTYWPLKCIQVMASLSDFGIIDISYNEVNGGSVRVALAPTGSGRINTKRSQKFLAEENISLGDLYGFSNSVSLVRAKVMAFLERTDLLVAGYGASTKGNTLLQYFGITTKHLPYIVEVNKDKYGMMTVGSDIPIYPEEPSGMDTNHAFFVLPWHFRKSILLRRADWIKHGGKFVFPLPKPEIVGEWFVEDL